MHIAKLGVVLLCAAAISCGVAAAVDVDTFTFPVFNASTMSNLFAVTDSKVVQGADLLLQNDPAYRSEGFLLLPGPIIHLWRARDGGGRYGVPDREASFNSTFTLSGSAAVAFVVLNAAYPTLNSPTGFRGNSSSASSAPDGTATAAGLAGVEAGAVRSYGEDDPAVGLNVTVTPNGTASPSSRTVWVEYNAAAHRLAVYVAAAGGQQANKPARATLDAELNLAAGGRTTENANVGFFAGRISDIVDGVSGWELTVDKLPGRSGGSRSKETSWVVVLVAVVLSVVATAAM